MSSKNTSAAEETSSSATSSRSESPIVAPFKHQHSFEERYADLINQQILENTINKEVLQRQVQAFFPLSRNTSKERTTEQQIVNEEDEVDNIQEETTKNEQRKCLEKLETLDIKDKEGGACD